MINKYNLLILLFITSFLPIENVASSNLEDQEGGRIGMVAKARNSLNSTTDWNDIEEGLPKAADIINFMKFDKKIEEAWQNAGGAGMIYPGEPGSYVQKTGRLAAKGAKIGWDLVEPFLLSAGARVASDIILSYAGPWLVENAGKAAANGSSMLNYWWTQYDPFNKADQGVRYLASRAAKGETLRNLGTLTDVVQKYAYPVAKTVCAVTKEVAVTGYSCIKYAASVASKAYNWGKSWFFHSEVSAAAAA